MSGICDVVAASEPNRIVLRFREGIREELRTLLTPSDVWRRYQEITARIAIDDSAPFVALVENPAGNVVLPGVEPFAELDNLVHDDASPSDTRRRGRDTVYVEWGSQHGGAQPNLDVFLSSTRKGHPEVAENILRDLTAAGFTVYRDTANDPGDSISDGIVAALRASRLVVVLYSAAYNGRRACQWEFIQAYLAGAAEGDATRRLLIVNPEQGDEHIVPFAGTDMMFLRSTELDRLPDLVRRKLDRLDTPMSGIRRLAERLLLLTSSERQARELVESVVTYYRDRDATRHTRCLEAELVWGEAAVALALFELRPDTSRWHEAERLLADTEQRFRAAAGPDSVFGPAAAVQRGLVLAHLGKQCRHSRLGHRSPITYENSVRTTSTTLAAAA